MNRGQNRSAFLRRVCRSLWRRLQLLVPPRMLPGGYSPGPLFIEIQLTYACNLRCSFCGQWGVTGTYKDMPAARLREKLPLATLRRLIGELPLSCAGVFLWGGETLQYPDIVPLVRLVRDAGMFCAVVTNGAALASYAAGLVEAGLHTLAVSIDAGEETHDRMRGARGTYAAAMEGIRRVRAERDARGCAKPLIYVDAVAIPELLPELPQLARQARAAGADGVHMTPVAWVTAELGRRHEEAFQELFHIAPKSWTGFARRAPFSEAERAGRWIEQIQNDPETRDFIVWGPDPRWRAEDWARYFAEPSYAAPADQACRFPWDCVCVYPNGDLSPCPDFPDYVVGNINDRRFSEIWNGELYRRFRQTLAERGRFPICTACCHLYHR